MKLSALLFALAIIATQTPSQPAPFTAHTVTTGIRGGYQVLVTDINKDAKPDLVAIGMQSPELVWFENPRWEKHVITTAAPRMINMDAADLDGDGIPELALAYEFATNPTQSQGRIAILHHSGDPKAPWNLKEIDAIPTSHRVRFANIDGQKILVNAPILAATAREGFNDPDHTPTPLHFYRGPEWKPETITEENKGVVHGLVTGNWDGDGRDEVLTAGYVGVFAHSLGADGKWSRNELSKGDPAPWPRGGASDIAIGRMNNKRFFVTNEAFHGNQVVVYLESARNQFQRNVIDTALTNSHSLTLIDADGDGNHEIVSGGTRAAAGSPAGTKPGVFYYRPTDKDGQKWERLLLDKDIAANSCVPADINGDNRIDLACIDNTAPNVLRWYENTRR